MNRGGCAARGDGGGAVLVLAWALLALPALAQTAGETAATKAFNAASLVRELESAVALAGGLTVRASPAALREGESLIITVALPRAGYLNVISVNPEGDPTVLFPNRFQSDNQVAAGAFSFPTPQMSFALQASAPFGESRVLAFLSTEPLNLFLNGDGQRDAAGALLDRFARLSIAGRDLINLFGTRTLQAGNAQPPLIAGSTQVLTCARTGPCTPVPAGGGTIRRIVDAIVPGIFLDKAIDRADIKGLPPRPMPARGLTLTKVSEGFVPRLYHDAAGYCTVAYGHLMRLSGCAAADRRRYPGTVSEPRGAELLVQDLALAQRAVLAHVKQPLSDGQYAALVDFTFNAGAGNLRRSTLLKAVNAGQHARVPFQLRRWTMAGGRELRGLRIRREREIALYFEGQAIPKDMPPGEDVEPLDIRRGEGP